MGCWSESCVISGMEISDGTPMYVALMKKNPHYASKWDVFIPPIPGTYDDYGGCNLAESNEYFGLKAGENWRPVGDARGQPVYLHAGVFDYLENLKPDFPYVWVNGKSKKVKTIGDQRDAHLRTIRDWIAKCLEDRVMTTIRSLSHGEVFGYGNEIQIGAERFVSEAILTGKTDFEEFLIGYGRAYVLVQSAIELRRLITPGIVGPQHNGEVALLQFNNHVNRLTRERQRLFTAS